MQILMYQYEKVNIVKLWKLVTIFKILTLIAFLLNILLFYMQNTVKYLHRIYCRFYVFICMESSFYVSIWESRCDKILKTHDYYINAEFELNIFYFICKTPLNICTTNCFFFYYNPFVENVYYRFLRITYRQ